MTPPDECFVILHAERDRHAERHACRDLDGVGVSDYCADDDEGGLEPCPLYRALTHALHDMGLQS